MKKQFYIVTIFVLMVTCSPKKEGMPKQEPLMYEASEMALLMRQMYEYNKVLKQQIVNKDSLISFPKDFLKINTAVLTDPAERDTSFEILSKKYIELQQSIHKNKNSVKEQFNKTINSCVSCHETRCDGPIPKIKRLLIN